MPKCSPCFAARTEVRVSSSSERGVYLSLEALALAGMRGHHHLSSESHLPEAGNLVEVVAFGRSIKPLEF